MPLLAIDSATRFSGIALIKDDLVIAEYLLQSGLTHSQRLLPAVDLILSDASLTPSDLKAIVVSKGPGSFTGLRIGMALGKGMAQALAIPIVAVSSLHHWAASLYGFLPDDSLVMPLLAAGRGAYYTALFRKEAGNLHRIYEDSLKEPEELGHMLPAASRSLYLTGDLPREGFCEILEILGEFASLPTPHLLMPRASSLAFLGQERYDKGDYDDLFTLAPLYIRVSEAERKRTAMSEMSK